MWGGRSARAAAATGGGDAAATVSRALSFLCVSTAPPHPLYFNNTNTLTPPPPPRLLSPAHPSPEPTKGASHTRSSTSPRTTRFLWRALGPTTARRTLAATVSLERERGGGVPHAAAAVVLKHLCSVALWPPNPSCKKTPSGAHTQLITQTKCTHHTLGVGDNGASSTFSVREALSGETNQHSDVDGWRARATPAPTACFALLPRARCLRVAVADNLTHHPPTTPANKKRRRCATVEDQAGPCRDVLPGVCWLDERQ